MHRVTAAQRLRVLVVTEDRALERQVSRFLDTVGYQVLQAAESHSAVAAIEAEDPHILLIGSDLASREGWELCGWLTQWQSAHELFKFLMVEEPDDHLVREALEAGLDDVLLLPLDYGELLSRLRAAARVLEFDRRASHQGRVDALTGLMSRSALTAEARRELADRVGSSSPRVACVALDIDFLSRVNRLQGMAGGDTLLKAVAHELTKLRTGSEMLGCVAAGRFAAILPGATDTAAVEWAEHARRALTAAKFKLGEANWQITASFGVAGCDAADSAEQLIEQATEALVTAKASGRNCVVRYGEFGADVSNLSGKLFERTEARDVMTPCTVLLQSEESVAEAARLFGRTQLEGIPVVDAEGELVGLCEREQIASTSGPNQEGRLVHDLMHSDVQRFGEQETLVSLLDFFTRDPRSMAVIVRKNQPIGFVTCSSLAALSQKLTTDSFAAEGGYRDSSDYLLVPDRCAVECDITT